jgi:hypothetical protein
MEFADAGIHVSIDHVTVATLQDRTYLCGMAGVGSGWHGAMFDNFHIQVASSSRNLASGKPARASSTWDTDTTAGQATDGNGFSTRWSAAPGKTSGEWIEVDFGKPTTFDTVVLKSVAEPVDQFAIQYWTGSEWLNATAGRNLRSGAAFIPFKEVTAIKVRFQAIQTSAPPSLWEFEVFHGGR